jgi:hypothetical protein
MDSMRGTYEGNEIYVQNLFRKPEVKNGLENFGVD